MKRLNLFFPFLIFATNTFAQKSEPDSIFAFFTSETIHLDGKLDEPVWQLAPRISNFTQRELHFGKPASEKTEVAIVYDELSIYIGIWCHQTNPAKIRAKYMQRDFVFDEDDNFQIALSPYSDRRNGYLFIINPNGARADLLISDNDQGNLDWNGVWDTRTAITSDGWFAEIQIPFNSLQFRNDSLYKWSINFERNIRYKNEQASWQGWTRDCSIFCLVNAGTLSGLRNITYARRFELKPYLLGGFEKLNGESTTFPGKVGADLNVNLSPSLKLNVTANTDFAQVEVDRIAVNLTRFNLFYPEKREFFLEAYQNYQFNIGGSNEIFYTRQIGIENFRQVPIIAGARLFGKIGSNNIGILDIETGAVDSVPATNNAVIRYKKDIGSQSYIGGIFTSKINGNISNQVAGLDGAYSTNKFLKNKNLVAAAFVSRSFDKNSIGQGTTSWRVSIDYPNDLIDHFIGVGSIQQNYNPDLGFLVRSNFDNLTWHFFFSPRWLTSWGFKRLYFEPWSLSLYNTHTTGDLESFYNESKIFGGITKNGEQFEYGLQQEFERLDQPFVFSPNLTIPIGKYWMYRQEIQAGTFQGRRIWVLGKYVWGGYYSGTIKTFMGSLGINGGKHFNLRTDYTYNDIKTIWGDVSTNELAEYIDFAFNPRLDLSIFVQWNSLDELLFGNCRLHWIPKIGADVYVVYNRGYDKLEPFNFPEPDNSSGAVKLVWRFSF